MVLKLSSKFVVEHSYLYGRLVLPNYLRQEVKKRKLSEPVNHGPQLSSTDIFYRLSMHPIVNSRLKCAFVLGAHYLTMIALLTPDTNDE